MVSEQQAEAAVKKLRQIIEAAENSNQAGEDAAVMAAAALDMAAALESLVASKLENGWSLGKLFEAHQKAFAALAKARGEA